MGLDIVEIVMACEERFGIAIPDNLTGFDFSRVGGLHEFVMYHLNEVYRPDVCLSSSLFYRIRRGLMKAAGLPRGSIVPDADLRNLVPFWRRPKVWRAFEKEVQMPLPRLVIPRWLVWTIHLIALGVLVYVGAVMQSGWKDAFTLSSILWVLLWMLASFSVVRSIPPDRATIRQYVMSLLPKQNNDSQHNTWTSELVWLNIQEIIAKQFSIPKEQVQPDSTWKELGAD